MLTVPLLTFVLVGSVVLALTARRALLLRGGGGGVDIGSTSESLSPSSSSFSASRLTKEVFFFLDFEAAEDVLVTSFSFTFFAIGVS